MLPGAAFAEKRGSMVNIACRLQRLNRAIEPPQGARDDWEILRDIAAGLTDMKSGDPEFPHLIEAVFKDMAAAVTEFSELSLSKIGDLGVPVTTTGRSIPLLENERARKAAGRING